MRWSIGELVKLVRLVVTCERCTCRLSILALTLIAARFAAAAWKHAMIAAMALRTLAMAAIISGFTVPPKGADLAREYHKSRRLIGLRATFAWRLTLELTRAPEVSSGARARGCVGLSEILGGIRFAVGREFRRKDLRPRGSRTPRPPLEPRVTSKRPTTFVRTKLDRECARVLAPRARRGDATGSSGVHWGGSCPIQPPVRFNTPMYGTSMRSISGVRPYV